MGQRDGVLLGRGRGGVVGEGGRGVVQEEAGRGRDGGVGQYCVLRAEGWGVSGGACAGWGFGFFWDG